MYLGQAGGPRGPGRSAKHRSTKHFAHPELHARKMRNELDPLTLDVPMTDLEKSAFFAELEAIAAAQDAGVPEGPQWLIDELNSIGTSPPVADARPNIVADVMNFELGLPFGCKVSGAGDGAGGQYAEAPVPQLTAHTTHTDREDAVSGPKARPDQRGRHGRPVWSIAADRTGSARSWWSSKDRKARRVAARIDLVAGRKTWEGTKSRKRKDKLSPAEKFSAAVWATAAAQGMAVSLNLGISREGMLLYHDDPRRRLTQNLSKQLAAVGLGDIPYAFVFEFTDREDGGRLHLHGVIDTSSLTVSQSQLLREALVKAASPADGAVGGQRQLDMAPLYNPAGWADYLLEDTAKTRRELRLDDPFMISKTMRRMARTHFELLRTEALSTTGNAKGELARSTKTVADIVQSSRRGFTVRSVCDRRRLSGERDKASVGGAQRRVHRRPNGRSSRSLGPVRVTGDTRLAA